MKAGAFIRAGVFIRINTVFLLRYTPMFLQLYKYCCKQIVDTDQTPGHHATELGLRTGPAQSAYAPKTGFQSKMGEMLDPQRVEIDN